MSIGDIIVRRVGVHMDAREIYYFGCRGELGHFLWAPHQMLRVTGSRDVQPWGVSIDGRDMSPSSTRKQGAAKLSYKDGWTALGMHDYTVDTRGNSHSVFLIHDILDYDAMLEVAEQNFPEISKRIGPIALVEVDR